LRKTAASLNEYLKLGSSRAAISSNAANGGSQARNILDLGRKTAHGMPGSRADDNVNVEVGDDDGTQS